MSTLLEKVESVVGKATPHPVLGYPDEAALTRWLKQPGGMEDFVRWHQQREEQIALETADPFYCTIEPETWRLADRQLAELSERVGPLGGVVLYLSGRNRVGKSYYAHKRAVQDLVRYRDIEILFLSETEKSSVDGQQRLVWHWLPQSVKALNGKQTDTFKVKWSRANGFTDGKLILPGGGVAYFDSYRSDPGKWEGFEFGSREGRAVAVVADENMPLPWLEVVQRRAKYRNAIVLWCYTPVQGITPTIKDLLGATPKPLEWAPAPMLPENRIYVPGVPAGHMPTVCASLTKSYVRAVYFHTSPYGNYAAQVAQDCEGKPSDYIKRMAYGWAEDVGGRAFPNFGPVNIIKPEELPAVGTNYLFVDPAGARPYSAIWVRVAPGNPGKIYVYRDWPDAQTYGEWAVPTARSTTDESKKGWDGDAGPAYNMRLGLGPPQYKEVFHRAETLGNGRLGMGNRGEKDPYRIKAAAEGHLQEQIFTRYGDPRAMATKQQTDKGAQDLFMQMAVPVLDKDGKVKVPAWYFVPVPVREGQTTQIEEGMNLLNELLFWDSSQPLMPQVNEPRLYVSEECKQVIWALENYTGKGGSTAPTKDWVDLLCYVAFADLRYVPPVKQGAGKYWGGY